MKFNMKMINIYLFGVLFVLSKAQVLPTYNCSNDGIPNILIDAGQGADPAIEFMFPLFSDCSSADYGLSQLLPPSPNGKSRS